jgi:hypothetical protein
MLYKNWLLFAMICCYLVPIYIVYNFATNNQAPSISSIICDDTCKYTIFTAMIAMGIFTVLYEYERKDPISFFTILFLLANIYCLIFIHEKMQMHYWFASMAFLSILFFMFWHSHTNMTKYLLALQFIFACLTINGLINESNDVFIYEVLFLLNFASHYFYLHYLSISNLTNSVGDLNIGLLNDVGTPAEVDITSPPVNLFSLSDFS